MSYYSHDINEAEEIIVEILDRGSLSRYPPKFKKHVINSFLEGFEATYKQVEEVVEKKMIDKFIWSSGADHYITYAREGITETNYNARPFEVGRCIGFLFAIARYFPMIVIRDDAQWIAKIFNGFKEVTYQDPIQQQILYRFITNRILVELDKGVNGVLSDLEELVRAHKPGFEAANQRHEFIKGKYDDFKRQLPN